jgi:hypothetical protein
MWNTPTFIFALYLQGSTLAYDLQPLGVVTPVAQLCGGSDDVVCVQRYVRKAESGLLNAHCI